MPTINPGSNVVVIGSGVSGLTAAVTLAEAGAKVAVYESQDIIGGTSVNFRGIFAVESEMQREKYITYSRDEAFKKIMEYSHWRANPRLVRAVVNESAETISWLKERGVIFPNVVTNIPEAPQTYHLVKNSGEDVIKVLIDKSQELGIPINTNTPVKRIIKTDCRITGVMIEDNGEEKQVDADAVYIATGGFANNKEWIKKYSGFELEKEVFPVGNEGKMGDGIRMAFEMGADKDCLGPLELLRTGVERPGTMSRIGFIVVQPYLWVNSDGERYCDESVSFDDTFMGNATVRQKDGLSYSIFDYAVVRYLMEKGIDKAMVMEFPPGYKLPGLDKEIEEAAITRSDEIFIADSINELAEKSGINPDNLQNTIDLYNKYCDQKHDELFAKNPEYMRPLREKPYYAVKAQTIFLGTLGGIKINHKTQVINTDNEPITGLYAGGFDAGGMYGDSYSIRYSTGLSSGFAVNSGRIAGKSILEFMLND